jgi:DNA-binding NtrC family response regulator
MRTVLIVDGYQDLVDSLAHQLELNRWRVIGAHTLDEAKRVAEGIHIDVVLTDELVTEGKGILIENAFRATGELKNTPFVYMVASASVGQTLQGRCVLAKPFTIAQALDTLATAASHGMAS